MTVPVLAADSIGRTFGTRRVLTAATLAVPSSQVTALLGRNGCGKTTLLRIMTGLERADGGTIRLHGRIVRPRLHRLADAGVFLLPERDLLGPLHTVRSHFDRLAARFGCDGSEAVERFMLLPLLDREAAELSGGERRRVEVALAFARRPACLVADEPLLGIAPRDVEIFVDAFRTLARRGCAVLMTGHEVRALLDVADEIVWMTGGTTHALGQPQNAMTNQSFVLDYLGPYHGGARVG